MAMNILCGSCAHVDEETPTVWGFPVVGATGFEPVTPAVSRQCSAAELSARVGRRRSEDTSGFPDTATFEATPGIEPGYRVLQTLA